MHMWESVGRSAFTLRGGEGAPPGVGKTGMRVRGATQVSSSKGGRAGPLAFAGDEVSLAGGNSWQFTKAGDAREPVSIIVLPSFGASGPVQPLAA